MILLDNNIHIENYEFFALKGAKRILKDDHPIVYLELWENENREKCFDLLKEFGYEAFVNIDNTLVPYNSATHKKQNFIFK